MTRTLKNIQIAVLRSLFFASVALTAVTVTSCNNEKGNTATTEVDGMEMIAGADNKEWKMIKETDATGDKQDMDRQEKDERLTFYRNGKFNQTGGANMMAGTWTYDVGTKTIAMTMDGATQSNSFTVSELNDKQMKLMAADGSALTLRRD